MKSLFSQINLMIFYVIISNLDVILSVDFIYPSSISLTNGNIFVVEQKGIYVYNEQLTNIIFNYTFKEEEKINDLGKLSNVIIKSKRNYIICLINEKIYFFNYEGKLLKETEKIITEENFSHLTLTPILLSDDGFYYYILGYYIYKNSGYSFKLLFYKINLSDNSNNYINELSYDTFISSFWSDIYYFQGKGLSFEYMNAENIEDNLFVCFFIIKMGYILSLSHNFFEVTTSSLSISNKYYYDYIKDLNDVKSLKVVTNNSKKMRLFVFFSLTKI